MFWLDPGDELTLRLDPAVIVASDQGRVQRLPGAIEAVYQAPRGMNDRLRFARVSGDSSENLGWVAVRVASPTGAVATCRTPRFGRLTGGERQSHRRATGAVHIEEGTSCVQPLSVEVEMYRLRPGEALRTIDLDADDFISLWSLGAGEVDVETIGATTTITGRSEGWVAVSAITRGSPPCRSTLLVEIAAPPVLDASVDVVPGPDVGMDVAMDVGTTPPEAGRDVNLFDVGQDVGMDVGMDAGMDAEADAPVDTGATPAPTTSFDVGDVLPIGLVEFDGGLFWYDNGNLDLHRFDLTTLRDRAVLTGTSVLLRDLVVANGRLYWTTGPTSSTQVVGWRPGDVAPTSPLLTGARAFDQLIGDGARVYAHEPGALQWMLADGTGLVTATSSSSQRAFHAADGRVYFADLGLGASPRGVFRVALSPPPATLLAARDMVIPGAAVADDDVLAGDLLVDGADVYALGHRHLLRARADGSGGLTELAQFPATASPTAAWTRMCLARGRVYMVEQFEGRLWSVAADGRGALAAVASPGGIGFSLACTADSVWWWSGPRLNRYRLP
jgi:hypothetical protein